MHSEFGDTSSTYADQTVARVPYLFLIAVCPNASLESSEMRRRQFSKNPEPVDHSPFDVISATGVTRGALLNAKGSIDTLIRIVQATSPKSGDFQCGWPQNNLS